MRINSKLPNASEFVIRLNGEIQGMCYEADDEEGWCTVFDPDLFLQARKTNPYVTPQQCFRKLEGKVEILRSTPELAAQVKLVVGMKLKKLATKDQYPRP